MEYNTKRFNTTREFVCHQTEQKIMNKNYGSPSRNFSYFTKLLNAHFDTQFSPADGATIMLLLKVSRLKFDPSNLDTHIDIAGYSACLAETKGLKHDDTIWTF